MPRPMSRHRTIEQIRRAPTHGLRSGERLAACAASDYDLPHGWGGLQGSAPTWLSVPRRLPVAARAARGTTGGVFEHGFDAVFQFGSPPSVGASARPATALPRRDSDATAAFAVCHGKRDDVRFRVAPPFVRLPQYVDCRNRTFVSGHGGAADLDGVTFRSTFGSADAVAADIDTAYGAANGMAKASFIQKFHQKI